MRYLRKYNEGVGDNLPDNDEFLILMNDLSLSISDIGFDVEVKGIESYERGLKNYSLFITSKSGPEIYDVNKDNISNLNDIDVKLKKINDLNSVCKDLIERAIGSGLHLCNYYISVKTSGVFTNIKFACKLDGSPVDPDYKYNNGEEY
jgi:hypothetical protein